MGNNIIELTGNIPVTAAPYTVYIPVNNASQYFVNTFYESLIDEGVEITGSALRLDEYDKNYDTENIIPLFTYKSDHLLNVVSEINKKSDNLLSEQLLKTIGYELYGYGSASNGINAVKELMKGMGINPNNFIMVDGSGLSSYNLVTPKQIVNLLAYMYRSTEFDSFYKSLAIAGYDGTLFDRMKRTKAENNFRGKSAFLENTRGLAGYIRTAEGEPLALALIVNNFLVPSQLANYILDRVCNRLANFTRN
ncbi:d-alanyl-d-alanine carboxypeptidase [hydrocarbon metagenome]|uniref:D-alanyl-d-alanine carboxypeptidase n=1 Tax=hydrocarbon metagenome TaxID=938273 RepID=A0A0W8FXW4_9ZZZZ